MKKRIGIILCFVFLFSLAGCADERAAVRNVNQAPSVNDVLEAGMAADYFACIIQDATLS